MLIYPSKSTYDRVDASKCHPVCQQDGSVSYRHLNNLRGIHFWSGCFLCIFIISSILIDLKALLKNLKEDIDEVAGNGANLSYIL